MKAIIDRKLYDTETAEEIASKEYSYPSDFHHWEEQLYRTKKGRWFLFGKGGARSKYGVKVAQNEWGPGEKIIALDSWAVINWCEKHDEPTVIEKYFSDKIKEA